MNGIKTIKFTDPRSWFSRRNKNALHVRFSHVASTKIIQARFLVDELFLINAPVVSMISEM
jgi:hypothetical protein